MSAYLYDQALVEQLRQVVGDERIHIISPDKAIDFLAQFSGDKTQLPAIVLSRGPISLLDYRNQVVSLKGQTAKRTDQNLITKARLLPMRMEWNIDVITVGRYECDEIVRELVFYFTTSPRFEVKVPYQLDIVQNFDVLLSSDIADNTDLLEFSNSGEKFRETLTIYTENAHMYHSCNIYPLGGFNVEVEDHTSDNKIN